MRGAYNGGLMITEIGVDELAKRLASKDPFVLLDVREEWELELAKIEDGRLQVTPMSELAQKGLKALPQPVQDKQAEIYVLCHTGVRSAQVSGWLAAQGWKNISSVAGGIDAYARSVDPGVGMY